MSRSMVTERLLFKVSALQPKTEIRDVLAEEDVSDPSQERFVGTLLHPVLQSRSIRTHALVQW